MTVELPEEPKSRKEQYLANIAGQDVVLPDEPKSREEQYLAYIAEYGGGGGGTTNFNQLTNRPKYNGVTMTGSTDIPKVTTYTAGTNVNISAGNVISATDTTYSDFTGTDGNTGGTAGLVPAPATTDANKFLKSNGTWAEIPGGSGGTPKILSESDYNWNSVSHSATAPFDSIAIWLLPSGFYFMPNDVYMVNDKTGSKTTSGNFNGDSFLALKEEGSVNTGWVAVLTYHTGAETSGFIEGVYNDTGSYQTGTLTNGVVLKRSDIVSNLTSSSNSKILSASQGKALNEKITPDTGATAPDTTTVGILGKIYIDTTNNDAYMCVNVSGSTYTWKKITA